MDSDSQVLREVELQLVSDSECETVSKDNVMQFNQEAGVCQSMNVSYKDKISPDMLCARPTYGSTGGRGTCQDDIGGPFTVQNRKDRHVLVGITSWGTGCAEVRTKWLSKPSHVFLSSG